MPDGGHIATLAVTFGIHNQTAPWTDIRRLAWEELAGMLTRHQVGPKEGTCFVPATFRGAERKKSLAQQIDIVVLDSDSGATLQEIVAAAEARGWAAIASSTHSHLTARTTAKRSHWARFLAGADDPVTAAEQFLIREKGYLPRVAAGAHIVAEDAEHITFAHQPCPKFRVVLLLQRPWRAADYPNQAAANAVWKERIEALAAALGLNHDQSCTDTSRLFYLPRRRADGPPPEIAVIDGTPCDIFALPSAPPSGDADSSSRRSSDTGGNSGKPFVYSDKECAEFDLLAWTKEYGGRFEIVAALKSRHPEAFVSHPVDSGKHHIRCPNEDAHTNAGEDRAAYCMNASASSSRGFVIHCRHGHCDGRDRLLFVRQMLEQGWLTVSDLTDGQYLLDILGEVPSLMTEHLVAEVFARRHDGTLKFCHGTGAWFRWDGRQWKQDRVRLAFHWARELTAELSRDDKAKVRISSGRAAFAGAVERFAQADGALACTPDIWNPDQFFLGTPSGTVDLRTGQIRDASPADFITKTVAVGPAAYADCPLWLRFLKQTTADDPELIAFLRQWCGYLLTGDTREHALLFIYGPGGNGKSVFLNTIRQILHDYCRVAAMETFTASLNDRHPTDLAMLHGARMVCATETDEGRAWAESRIKQLTGGDKVAARFMRQDFFEYTPEFKLMFAGNHKPALRNVDESTRRRFNIVPFVHRPLVPDRELEVKLRREWPGILRWMIEGCVEWQRTGLVRPKVVLEATADYFDAQDVFGRWLAEHCTLHADLTSKPGVLLSSCRAWAETNGETVPSPPQFRSALEKVSGVRYVKVKGVHWVKGIGLVPPGQNSRGGREGDGE